MTSHFAVLQVRPSQEASRTAQERAGGRSWGDGVLPLKTLAERPEAAGEPTDYAR
ncbi:hypothetical protein [Streptomyces flaveolus]|uniref:hypothetical protein n=1 Tax=Streptomyces flaveolus TaxID=67297 RepID=UPI0033C31BEC